MKVLSIDAWRDDCGWSWNQWWHVGDVDVLPKSNRAILAMMRDEGYLSECSKGRVSVEDDQYNVVICDRANRRPLFAIEYGSEQ